ncbi:hypothetical protein U9M48_000782 [Paspalum notatum var. saurae]|uniref:Myb/SANT-like domain-containing protein n=1 Tax=Paspalum notatum var. saurae TaxID=547442 RepID=A0AAQ3PM95_PASNO
MSNQRQRISPSPPNPPLPSSATPQGLDAQQSWGTEEPGQEKGTAKNRAKWNHQMRVYLISLLKQHDVPKFRTHNAWSKEAWKSIVGQFNKKFTLSFTVGQVKQKEQDMKKDFRVVKDLVAESGFGWDSDKMMVTALPDVWASMEARQNKDALNWRDKSFPYYDDLFVLYHGRYAEGRSCRGMDHYANKASPPSKASPDVQQQPHSLGLSFDVEESTRDDTNWFGTDPFAPLGNMMPHEVPDGPISSNLVPNIPDQSVEIFSQNSQASNSTQKAADGKHTKKQKTTHTNATEDFHEKYLKLKREEIDRFAAIEEKKMEDPFSIKACITVLEGLTGLQAGDILQAADIFKDSPSNREVFLSFASDELRVGWLLRQI